MKKLLLLLVAFVPSALSAALVPTPRECHPGEGTFRFTSATTLSHAPALAPLADYLGGYLTFAGVSESRSGDHAVALNIDPTLGEEAYRLEITPDRIVVSGGDYGGAFYGVQTLMQLFPAEIYAKRPVQRAEIPCMTIADAPKYHYRGMMLDVARTWQEMPAVMRYIDLLAYHKINKFHFHLADDEGWRIEIKSHPELTEIGAWRGGDSPVQSVYGKYGEKYGGFYTQEQLRELIDYAAVRNIEIIPELDLPGHSRNIASIHPEIRCNYPHNTAPAMGYDYRSAWCVAREENYALLADILGEICDLFPSPYIHVGGDEVDTSQWNKCPDCQAMMREHGITTGMQLQGLFLKRIDRILRDHGKLAAVWDESLESGMLAPDSHVHGWSNVKSCLKSTAAGYPTIIMPAQYFYFDMRQTPREDGHDWAAVFDAKGTYDFDFDRLGFTAEQQSHIIGMECAFWSEAFVSHHSETQDYLDYMLFPRICTFTEMAWSGKPKPWKTFLQGVVDEHYDRMAAMKLHFRLFPPQLHYADGAFTASTDDGSELFYTIWPDTTEHRYTAPVRTAEPWRYQFRSRYKTALSPQVADESFYRLITPEMTFTSSIPAAKSWPFERLEHYSNQSRTARACREGDWLLFTFASPVASREIAVQTGNRQLPKAIFPSGYVEVSYDGERFEPVGELYNGSLVFRPVQAVKAVRVVSTCEGNGCPFVTLQPLRIKPLL